MPSEPRIGSVGALAELGLLPQSCKCQDDNCNGTCELPCIHSQDWGDWARLYAPDTHGMRVGGAASESLHETAAQLLSIPLVQELVRSQREGIEERRARAVRLHELDLLEVRRLELEVRRLELELDRLRDRRDA